jgi:hypothetical protein
MLRPVTPALNRQRTIAGLQRSLGVASPSTTPDIQYGAGLYNKSYYVLVIRYYMHSSLLDTLTVLITLVYYVFVISTLTIVFIIRTYNN